MAYTWSWFGAANLTASVLMLAAAFLLLQARRTEFIRAFAAFSVIGAASKFCGGMWLYFSADPATANFWHQAVAILWLPLLPALAHAMAAFVWGRSFSDRPRWVRALIYVPFAAFVPLMFQGTETFQRLSFVFGFVFTVALLPFLILAARKWRSASTHVERVQGRYMFIYLLIVLSFTAESRAVPVLIEGAAFPHWELAIAYVVATSILVYGILKQHVFDIDLKLKFAIRRSTVAAVFIAAFFVVSEAAEQVFSARVGPVFGLAAAGLLVFALAPLHRLAERVSDAAMPAVRETPEYLTFRKLAVYKAACESALEDGVITSRERAVLRTLQAELGIQGPDATAIEGEVQRRAPAAAAPA